MTLLVASLKPAALKGWSQFYRIKLMEGAKAWWEEIDEKKTSSWRIWQPADPTKPFEEGIGFWNWSLGGFLNLWPPLVGLSPDGRSVRFDNVPWNFREICRRTPLTGPGLTLPDNTKITWVMGLGVPAVRQLSCDDPFLRPSDCAQSFVGVMEPLKTPPLPGPPHRMFAIRILWGKPSSSSTLPGIGDTDVMRHKDHFAFEIVDLVGDTSTELHYTGTGFAGLQGFGASNLEPIFLTPQPPTVFTTPGPVTNLSDFAGDARMVSDPKTGRLHLILESKKLPPAPGTGPGLDVELKTDSNPLPPPLNVGSETKGTLDFPNPTAEFLEGTGAKPFPPPGK
jgi:hypothetical protein